MHLSRLIAAFGLFLAVGAAPVAGFAMVELAPVPNVGTLLQPVETPNPTPPHEPGWGDFGGPGNPYGPDATAMGVHWGGGAFSDQQPAD